jgi:hypothetical protein
MTQPAPLLVIKSSGGGGIGDNIRSLIAGIDYARRSGRSIYVDWSDGMFGPEGINVFSDFFEILGLPTVSDLKDYGDGEDVFPLIWKNNLHNSLKTLWTRQDYPAWDRNEVRSTFSFDQERLDYAELVLVMWDFDGYFAAPQALLSARTLAQRHLSPAGGIKAEVDHFVATRLKNPVIGIHVRETAEATAGGKALPVSLLTEKASKIASEAGSQCFFLCTDNQHRQEQIQQQFSNVIVRKKQMPPAGESIHLSEFGPTAFEKTRDALLDLLTLSRCDYIIYPAFSSFSMCATLLSATPVDRIYPIASPNRSGLKSLGRRAISKLRTVLRY